MGLMKRVLTEAHGPEPRKPAGEKAETQEPASPASSAAAQRPVVHSPGPQSIHPEMVTRMILRELSEIPVTIEAPAHIFAMLKRNLMLRKAALLLPDPDESMYVPWSITGFDITTQRRLHIPEQAAYELFNNRVPLMLHFNGPEMEELQSYFSVREYTAFDKLVLCSFFYEAKLLAILAIAEAPFLALDPTILQVMYSAFEEGVSTLLYRSRDERIARIQLPLLFAHDQLLPMAQESLTADKVPDASILFLEFDPEPSVAAIADLARETDRYRVRQDVLRILNTLLSGLGKVFTLPRHRLLLMRTEIEGDSHLLDVELLTHQINERLRQYFAELDGSDATVTCRLVAYPRDTADLEALTASFA